MSMQVKRITAVITSLVLAASVLAFGVPDDVFAAAKKSAKKPARVKWTSVKRSGSKAVLKWKKAKNAKKYQVYSRIKGAKWKLAKTLKKRTVKLSVKAGKTYQYKIRGVNGKKRGKFSAVRTLEVPTKKVPSGDDPIVEPEPLIEILIQPGDVEVVDGQKAEFTVEADGEGLTYQWYSNTTGGNASGTKIEGADQPVYSFTARIRDNGRYFYCVISNESEKVKTSAARLTIQMDEKAYVISQTEKIDTYEGRSVLFEVEGYGVGKVTYQWYKNDTNSNEGGEPIEDAVNPTYQISRVYLSNSGEYYYCVVTDTIKKSGVVIKETQAVSEPIPLTVSVSPEHIKAVADIKSVIADHGVQTTNTVTIDDKEYYVIAEEDGKALLFGKEEAGWKSYAISEDYTWRAGGPGERRFLNSTFLKDNVTVDVIAADVPYYAPDHEDGFREFSDRVFTLSQADVTGAYTYRMYETDGYHGARIGDPIEREIDPEKDFSFNRTADHIGKALPYEISMLYVDGEPATWFVRSYWEVERFTYNGEYRYYICFARVNYGEESAFVECGPYPADHYSYARAAFWVDISE